MKEVIEKLEAAGFKVEKYAQGDEWWALWVTLNGESFKVESGRFTEWDY